MVWVSGLVAALTLLLLPAFYLFTTKIKARKSSHINLPPGSLGWPLVGETLKFLGAQRDGKPEDFVQERMAKHDSRVFKTSLLGGPMAVLCGPMGNKFLFGNETKLVSQWWPTSVRRLFGPCLVNFVGDEAKRMRKVLMTFLNHDALVRYITTMDAVTKHHITTHWQAWYMFFMVIVAATWDPWFFLCKAVNPCKSIFKMHPWFSTSGKCGDSTKKEKQRLGAICAKISNK